MAWKSVVKAIPVVGPALKKAFGHKPQPFAGSAAYWEQRYQTGGHSGAGSYDRLADFKAEFLNHFVDQHRIGKVVEWGTGDGAQLKLADYPSYVGIDVSETAVKRLKADFADHPEYQFFHTSEVPTGLQGDLVLSLDVIYHLVEDDVFDQYMRALCESCAENLIIYASNEDKAWSSPHVRHRRFETWLEQHRPEFMFMNHVPNRYPFDEADQDNTSFADFWVYRRSDAPGR